MDEKDNKEECRITSTVSKRKPSFTRQIHIPGYPNAFTYLLCNGKRKIDQSIQSFCVKNKLVGVFEVKLELKKFGLRPKQIGNIIYDANTEGISVEYNSKTHGFKMFVPYPTSITVRVPKNAEAIYLGTKIGILSCRIPIIDHTFSFKTFDSHKQPKLGGFGGKKKRKWNKKMDGRLQRNHAKLSQMQMQNALQTDDDTKLTGFQKSLYNKETDQPRNNDF